MTNFAIAMLAGLLLALIAATAQQKWSCKVFFLLALRLAIGWHFLFEGMHKIHSHWIGPTETNRPFTSEPYFKASPTSLGQSLFREFRSQHPDIVSDAHDLRELDLMQRFFDLTPQVREKIQAEAAAEIAEIEKQRAEQLAKAASEAEKKAINTSADDAIERSKVKGKSAEELARSRIADTFRKYIDWVHVGNPRDTKVKFVQNADVPLTAANRLNHIYGLRSQLARSQANLAAGVGAENGSELKRAGELRMELATAEADLVKDANALLAQLRKELVGTEGPFSIAESRGQKLDRITMWFIAVIGGCLLLGFCTRLSCVLAAGFLVMTYAFHPAFPWYPLPPNTEGNPVFINKNVIECLALLTIACFPTGKWLGLDAILCRCCCWKQNKVSVEA